MKFFNFFAGFFQDQASGTCTSTVNIFPFNDFPTMSSGTGLLYKIESDGSDWFYVVLTKAL